MHFKHVCLSEFFSTLRALKWLLFCVDLHVSFETAGREETFVALRAGVGAHSGVVPVVQLKVAGLCETLFTMLTLEGLVPSVVALVLQQLSEREERLATFRAEERPFTGVGELVSGQTGLVCKCLVTQSAFEDFVLGVASNVSTESPFPFEAFATV